jgi:maltose/moltooligosaccharide transporter
MADRPFPWRKTFILGFGFFGISIIWPLFNSLIPSMLEGLGLAATVIGFIMTRDNIIKMMTGPPGSGKTLLARSLPSTPSVCHA